MWSRLLIFSILISFVLYLLEVLVKENTMYLLGKTLLQRVQMPLKNASMVLSKRWQPVKVNLKKLTTNVEKPMVSFPAEMPKHPKLVGFWLLSTAGMVSGAVIIGGLTRLTESGLSMVEWNLIRDMRPPQSEEEWQKEFEKYQEFPEYKHKSDVEKMTLEQFKRIYYYEFSHRMWGRAIGLWFLLPAAAFWARGYLTKHLKTRVLVLGSLLLGQGAMGWYMVKSGLVENENVPRVSPYRLSAHLGLALFLYVGCLWNGLTLVLPQVRIPETSRWLIKRTTHPLMLLIFTTAMSGAFVAGNDAGLTYNSWPKMADRWIPTDILAMEPKWKNFFENPTTVQFIHRRMGEITFCAIMGIYFATRRTPGLHNRARMALNALVAMSVVQVGLGITTLLTYVPIHLAATHQTGSVALLSCALWFAHETRRWKLPVK